MAVPRKGWRKVTVDGTVYSWRAIGMDVCGEREPGVRVVIVTDAAFERGSAQQLIFELEYDHLLAPSDNGGTSLTQQAAITPGVIRAAIERARRQSPPFTGERDTANIELSDKAVAEMQSLAHLEAPAEQARWPMNARRLQPPDR